MDWRIDPADLRDLTPVLARLLEAELAAGNFVSQTWRGWPESSTLCVMLERPFQSATRDAASAVGGVYYDAVHDPHHWGEELVHGASGHMLVTELHPRPRISVSTLFGRDLLTPSYHREPTYDMLRGDEPRYRFQCVRCDAPVTLDLTAYTTGDVSDERILGESAAEEVRQHFRFNAVGKSHDGGWPWIRLERCEACRTRYLVYVGAQEPANGAYRLTVQGIAELKA